MLFYKQPNILILCSCIASNIISKLIYQTEDSVSRSEKRSFDVFLPRSSHVHYDEAMQWTRVTTLRFNVLSKICLRLKSQLITFFEQINIHSHVNMHVSKWKIVSVQTETLLAMLQRTKFRGLCRDNDCRRLWIIKISLEILQFLPKYKSIEIILCEMLLKKNQKLLVYL